MGRTHRCAVCWQEQPDHDQWHLHATVEHGATSLDDFGLRDCHYDPKTREGCVGVAHVRKPPGYGVSRPRVRPEPTPVRGKDGQVYSPVKLPDFS